MRKNILFITSKFLPNADANGICVANVAYELQKMGYNILCLSEKNLHEPEYETINGIRIFRVEPTMFMRVKNFYNKKTTSKFREYMFTLMKLFRKAKLPLILLFFPNVSPFRSFKLYKKFEIIHQECGIDCVIGVFRPYEGIYVAQKAKSKYPHITSVALFLDLLRGVTPPKPMSAGLYNKMCIDREVGISEKVDKVLIPESAKDLYSNSEFDLKKFDLIDFPLFAPLDDNSNGRSVGFNSDDINIVYAGSMDLKNRNPEYFLSVLSEVYKVDCRIRFHIFGTLNGAGAIIEKYKKLYPEMIIYHGKVSYSEVCACLGFADFLVNISNKTTPKMVPSKIFQLFATKKPIINVRNNVDDFSSIYFEKYPLTLDINEHENNFYIDAAMLEQFLTANQNVEVSSDIIEQAYIRNSPKYTANRIHLVIDKVRNFDDEENLSF